MQAANALSPNVLDYTLKSRYPCPTSIYWNRVGGDDETYGNSGFCRGSGRKVDPGRGNAQDVFAHNFAIGTWTFTHDYSAIGYLLPHEMRVTLFPNTSITQGELRFWATLNFEYAPGSVAGTIIFEFKPIIANDGNEIIVRFYGLESPFSLLQGYFDQFDGRFNNGIAADSVDMAITTGELRD
jgi:hypothetical protein